MICIVYIRLTKDSLFVLRAGHSEVVKAIIKKDTMCVKDRDENNNTPLHLGKIF